MAGLMEYATLGLGVAGLYIGVKYGGQIIHNLQGNQANPPGQTSQQPDQTSTAPASTTPPAQGDNLDVTPATPTHVAPRPQPAATNPEVNPWVVHPGGHVMPAAGQTHPSNTQPDTKHTTIPRRGHTHHPHPHLHKPGKGCYCNATALSGGKGTYQNLEGQTCNLIGQPCENSSSYLGYFDGYEMAVTGPQWRKTINNRFVVANQGMVNPRGRIRRALAANNHDFMPGGFLLSEASVRRGVNNVYSAGT